MMVTSVTLAKGLQLEHNFASFPRSFGQLDTLNCKLSWASNLCVSFYFHFPMFFFHSSCFLCCLSIFYGVLHVLGKVAVKLLPHATLASGQCFSFATVFYRCCQKFAIYSQLDGKLALCKWGVHTIVKHAYKTENNKKRKTFTAFISLWHFLWPQLKYAFVFYSVA